MLSSIKNHSREVVVCTERTIILSNGLFYGRFSEGLLLDFHSRSFYYCARPVTGVSVSSSSRGSARELKTIHNGCDKGQKSSVTPYNLAPFCNVFAA